jgi:predicted outer membrane lipoprotein
MDEVIAGLILAVALAIINALLAYMQRADKKEAEEQGDVIVNALELSVSGLQAFVPFMPSAKDAIDAYAKIVSDIKAGWNDKKVSTEQLQEVLEQGEVLMMEIKGLISR